MTRPPDEARAQRGAPAPPVCAVPACVAIAADASVFCLVHTCARVLTTVLAGTVCARCGRRLEVGDWVTREASATEATHAVCPRPPPCYTRKVTRPKPLLESAE